MITQDVDERAEAFICIVEKTNETKKLGWAGWKITKVMIDGYTYDCHTYIGQNTHQIYYTFTWVDQEND